MNEIENVSCEEFDPIYLIDGEELQVHKFYCKAAAEKWAIVMDKVENAEIVDKKEAIKKMRKEAVEKADYRYICEQQEKSQVLDMVQEELHRVTYNQNDSILNLRIGDRLSQSDTDSFLALLLYEGLHSGLRNSEHIIITRKEYEDNYGESVNNLLSAAAKLIDCVGYIYDNEYNVIDTYTVSKDIIVITSDFLHQLLLNIVNTIVPIVTAYSYLPQIFREIIWQEQKNISFFN